MNISGDDAAAIHVRIVNRGTIPAERLQSLFEPFQAGRNTQQGLGLGLYIASQFVQAHGGTVKVSAVDAGEIAFEFFIPRTPPEGSGQISFESVAVLFGSSFLSVKHLDAAISTSFPREAGIQSSCAHRVQQPKAPGFPPGAGMTAWVQGPCAVSPKQVVCNDT